MNTNYAYELKQKVFTVIQISQFFFSQISYIQVKYICCTGIFYRDACLAIPSDHRNDSFVHYKYLKDVHYGCLKNIFCTLWMSQKPLFMLWMSSKTSFVRYGCLKDVFLCYGCLKDIFCTLWMSQRRLLYVMNIPKPTQRRPVFTRLKNRFSNNSYFEENPFHFIINSLSERCSRK